MIENFDDKKEDNIFLSFFPSFCRVENVFGSLAEEIDFFGSLFASAGLNASSERQSRRLGFASSRVVVDFSTNDDVHSPHLARPLTSNSLE